MGKLLDTRQLVVSRGRRLRGDSGVDAVEAQADPPRARGDRPGHRGRAPPEPGDADAALLRGKHHPGEERISENPLKPKFAEIPFPDDG